jgi:hypothetical protein
MAETLTKALDIFKNFYENKVCQMVFHGLVEQAVIGTCCQQMWCFVSTASCATEGKDTEGKEKTRKYVRALLKGTETT